jgi:hypothetical protein
MAADASTPDSPVTKRSKLFWLRIAVSVFFGLLTMALGILWVRSYQKCEGAAVTYAHLYCSFMSYPGTIGAGLRISNQPLPFKGYLISYIPTQLQRRHLSTTATYGFRTRQAANVQSVRVPHWFASMLVASIAVAPWLSHFTIRFSLRTLLIATTLAASVLGLMVWASR